MSMGIPFGYGGVSQQQDQGGWGGLMASLGGGGYNVHGPVAAPFAQQSAAAQGRANQYAGAGFGYNPETPQLDPRLTMSVMQQGIQRANQQAMSQAASTSGSPIARAGAIRAAQQMGGMSAQDAAAHAMEVQAQQQAEQARLKAQRDALQLQGAMGYGGLAGQAQQQAYTPLAGYYGLSLQAQQQAAAAQQAAQQQGQNFLMGTLGAVGGAFGI